MDARERLYHFLALTLQTDNEQILDALADRSEIIRVPKGTMLYREGETIEDGYSLIDGIVRAFYTDPDGREITEWIVYRPGTIILPCYVLSDSMQAKASGEAVTDCEILSIPLSSLTELSERSPEFNQVRVRVLQARLESQAAFKRNLAHKSPAERYAWLMENRAEIMEKVPQKHIASFLGITPVSLSRIRSRYKEKPAEE